MPSPSNERIRVTKEEREAMIASLIGYFRDEREEQLGNLGAELLLRRILKDIAPAIYNQGVRDAARFMQSRVEDLSEIELYPE